MLNLLGTSSLTGHIDTMDCASFDDARIIAEILAKLSVISSRSLLLMPIRSKVCSIMLSAVSLADRASNS